MCWTCALLATPLAVVFTTTVHLGLSLRRRKHSRVLAGSLDSNSVSRKKRAKGPVATSCTYGATPCFWLLLVDQVQNLKVVHCQSGALAARPPLEMYRAFDQTSNTRVNNHFVSALQQRAVVI